MLTKSTSSTERTTIRNLTAADIDQVAALWMRCFRASDAAPSTALKQYFREVMLDHPWFDSQIAPLVMDLRGEVVGFIGRMARPMQLAGAPIRAAVATQLMVDPQRKLGFAAIELVRAVQSGPQDFTFSDGANDHSLRIWTRCGGRASRLLSSEWIRPLRPLSLAVLRARDHGRLDKPARLARPLVAGADAVGATILRPLYRIPEGKLHREDATGTGIVAMVDTITAGASVRPVYDAASYTWLLQKTSEATAFGPLRSCLLRDDGGEPVGWFVYFPRPHQVAQVLQVGASPGFGQAVLKELFRDAWEHKAVAISGALDPLLLSDMSNSHCTFRCASMGVLLHSQNPELLAAIERGDGYLSRLEGEWWMRFGIDRHLDW